VLFGCEQVAIEYVISAFEEHLLPAIAALGHVIGIAGQDEGEEDEPYGPS
jgi:hypothetical protein